MSAGGAEPGNERRGAAIGGGGNRMMGKRIVENARAAFGAAPARWTTTLRVLPAVGDNTGN